MMTNVKNISLKRFEILLVSGQKVFTAQDIAILWQIKSKTALYANIQYYLNTGRLYRVHKGIYVLGKYTSFELGQKLITPSYISFYTALAAHGIIFQIYEEKHYMALKSKKIVVNEEVFVYHQLKGRVFFDQTGIEDKVTYKIASPERAICDSLYLASGLAFDSLRGVNFNKLLDIAQIYGNERLLKEVKELCLTSNSTATI